jgi:GTP 3',8-cyclase
MMRDRFNRPLRDLRISVTDRCNFRCTYCMPSEIFGEAYHFLPRAELLTFEEMTRISRLLVKLGVVKLRITGGEPLVRQELERLIVMLNEIPGVEDIALTTNGYFLPQKAQLLKDAGLHRLTVSLDTLDEDVFQKMNGRRSSVAKVIQGLEAAEKAGFERIKINSVIQRGVNDHTVVDLARWAKERGYIMRFIEYMDVGTLNGWRMDDVVPAKEIIESINAVMPVEPEQENYFGEVAARWRYVDGSGEFGVITSVTQPFCGTCTRMRLSPEGKFFTCLFGTKGTDLRDAMRQGATDEELEAIVRNVWRVRDDRYSEIRTSLTKPVANKVQMYHIGG